MALEICRGRCCRRGGRRCRRGGRAAWGGPPMLLNAIETMATTTTDVMVMATPIAMSIAIVMTVAMVTLRW